MKIRIMNWLHDTMLVIGVLAAVMFIYVNVFGRVATLRIPNTPVFAQVVVDEQLDEYLEATKPMAKGK